MNKANWFKRRETGSNVKMEQEVFWNDNNAY